MSSQVKMIQTPPQKTFSLPQICAGGGAGGETLLTLQTIWTKLRMFYKRNCNGTFNNDFGQIKQCTCNH